MPRTTRGRVSPAPKNGRIDRDAPFWSGDTAENLIERRIAERPVRSTRARRTSTRARSDREPLSGDAAALKTLRRLERNVSRRKTLAARVRLQQRIDLLRSELGL